MRNPSTPRLALYCNPDAGGSGKVIEAISGDPRIGPELMAPAEMRKRIATDVRQGVKRIFVGGGDGTIALAAALLAGTATELAVIPSGTLNHFARRTGIPIRAQEALHIAMHNKARPVDVAYVNDVLFINTSSVGAYPAFVRSRKYLENRMHYFPASIIAGTRRLLRFRLIRIKLAGRILDTPLVFVGVGERELRLPAMGHMKEAGRQGLHLLAIECDSMVKIFMLVIKSFLGGVDPMNKAPALENQVADSFEMNFQHHPKKVHVALDGELHWLETPLRYRLAPGELMVALPGNDPG